MRDLVIFDTSTLPEYYADVHKILALPRGHVVTYDYSQGHVTSDAAEMLETPEEAPKPRVLLAYVQDAEYKKGLGTTLESVLPDDSFATLTRLAQIVAVRVVKNNDGVRYYIDLKLLGYPFDRDRAIATSIVGALRIRDAIPMKIYVAACPDTASDVLFSLSGADAQGFSSVVDGLSLTQFAKDTFWRIDDIAIRTKSVIPMTTSRATSLSPTDQRRGLKTESVLQVDDQSTLAFSLQFHRSEEHGTDYRSRLITVTGSPKSSADLALNKVQARSFGQETIAVAIPATSSLSRQEARYQVKTELHERDEQRDYPYGPDLSIVVHYRKSIARAFLSIAAICVSSGLLAWASFVETVGLDVESSSVAVRLSCRIAAVCCGVLVALYAYYLWSDDVALDKALRK